MAVDAAVAVGPQFLVIVVVAVAVAAEAVMPLAAWLADAVHRT